VELVESYLEGWRIGRGRAVDGDVLIAAGVSSKFLGRLESLLAHLGGNASSFARVLEEKTDERVKNFRAKSKQSLLGYLETHGYLDSREALDGDRLRTHVLAAVAGQVQAGSLTSGEVAARVDRLFRLSGGQSNGASGAGGGRVAPETPIA
jgi:hypothetical protein